MDDKLESVQHEIDQLLRRLRELRQLERQLGGGRQTRLLVKRIEIKKYVEIWLELYDRQGYERKGIYELADKANVSHKTVRNILGQNGYVAEYIELYTADKLLQAMNMTHIISDLQVFEGRSKNLVVPEPPPSLYYEE